MSTITSTPRTVSPALAQRTSATNASAPQEKTMVDRVVDKTFLGANYTASAFSGTVGGLGGYARSVVPSTLKAAAAIVPNLWKAETIGPNLKILGTVAALPAVAAGAVVGLPVSLVAGLYHGASEVDSSKPRQFTIGPALREGYGDVKGGWEKMTEGIQKGMTDFAAEKLGEGEKPLDIPIIKTGKALAMGVAGAAIGGVAGLVSACVGTIRESAAGIGQAFKDENLNLPGKVIASAGAVVGGVVHGLTYGVATTVSIAGKGMAETWKQDSMVGGGKAIAQQAGKSVAASFNPKGTLLQERA